MIRSRAPSPSPSSSSGACEVSIAWLGVALALLIWQEGQHLVGGGAGGGALPLEVERRETLSTGTNSWMQNSSWRDPLRGIRDRAEFNLSSPIVLKYAEMLDKMLSVFSPIEGIAEGMGSSGMVNKKMLQMMAEKPQFMSCAGHVRIVEGKVYFRYGGFISTWYRLRRFNQSIKMLQDAVTWYGLTDLRVELFLNTCDLPVSFDNALATSARSGSCLFSTQRAAGTTTDIVAPDPLDLAPDYMPAQATQVAWEEKANKAFFRGASTNYDLQEYTWRASPRLRLHLMSDLFPDLLDARIMRWSHIREEDLDLIEADGVRLGKRVSGSAKSRFKYEIAVDGGVGTCRTCGLLASNQVMIRQASGFEQFFEPLLEPGKHYLRTQHHFQDLPDVIDWARRHDQESREMVKRANDIANWVCTWEGRTLYWAIALAKYAATAIDKAVVVEKPAVLCGGNTPQAVLQVYEGYGKKAPRCGSPEEFDLQPPCVHWCTYSTNKEKNWQWLSSDVFQTLERLGPRQASPSAKERE